MARPCEYTPAVAEKVCNRLKDGESLVAICSDPDLPNRDTVLRWALNDVGGFRAIYREAREIQAEKWADEIVEIADNSRNDYMTTKYGKQIDKEHVMRSNLRIESRKWLLSKLLPKKYGDITKMQLSGPDGGPIELRSLSDEQIAQRLTAVLAKVQQLRVIGADNAIGAIGAGDNTEECQEADFHDVSGDGGVEA